jgi:flagellar motor switch/type III secretory pathway protein FliN
MRDLRVPLSTDVSWRPIQLPRLSALHAQACTALAQRAWDVSIDAGVPWRAALTPVPSTDSRFRSVSEGIVVRLRWEGGVFHLRMPPEMLAACAQSLVPDVPLPEMPTALVQLILEGVLVGVQQALGISGAAITCLDSIPVADPAVPGLLLELQGVGVNGTLIVPIQTDAEGLIVLARYALRRSPPLNDIYVGDVPVTLRAVVGETMLSAEMVEALREGDAVIVERYHPADGKSLPMRTASGWSLMANCEHSALLSAGQWQPDSLQDAVPPDHGRMSFELGRAELQLHQLMEAAHTEIPLAALPGDVSVRIYFNDQPVGAGSLVEVDGRIAVLLASPLIVPR